MCTLSRSSPPVESGRSSGERDGCTCDVRRDVSPEDMVVDKGGGTVGGIAAAAGGGEAAVLAVTAAPGCGTGKSPCSCSVRCSFCSSAAFSETPFIERHVGCSAGRGLDTPSECAAAPAAVAVAGDGVSNSSERGGASGDFCSCSGPDVASFSAPVAPRALDTGLVAMAAAATAVAADAGACGCPSASCPCTNGCSAASAIVIRREG